MARKVTNDKRETDKREKWDTCTAGPGIWQEKHGKWDTNNVWSGIRWENWKSKKWETHCRIWNMARNTEKREY